MSLHTLDPTAGVLDDAVRRYLTQHPDWPIRYDCDAIITNTPAALGKWSWYVLIDRTADDAVQVAAMRRWLGGRLRLRQPIGEPTTVALPTGLVTAAASDFLTVLDVAVTMALADLEAAKSEESQSGSPEGRHRD